jgi:hypothetical protein
MLELGSFGDLPVREFNRLGIQFACEGSIVIRLLVIGFVELQ